MEELPVQACLPDLCAALAREQPVILRAPPGAGKTTGVPPAILETAAAAEGQVLLLQPRRMAARAAAHRLADQEGGSVGDTYGYHVRFDRKVSRGTKLIAMTTGVLVRQLIADPLLEQVSCVILDEFHERSIETDLGARDVAADSHNAATRTAIGCDECNTRYSTRLVPDRRLRWSSRA